MTKLDELNKIYVEESEKLKAEGNEEALKELFESDLSKQIHVELWKAKEALDNVKIINAMDKTETISLIEVAGMFDLPNNTIRKITRDYSDEFASDGYKEGRYTRRSILRLSMFLPSDNYLVDAIKRHLLNVAGAMAGAY